MQLKRIDRYLLLQIFGDGKPHSWNEVVWFCIVRLNLKPKQISPFLQNAVINHQLIKRVGFTSDLKGDSFIITTKGDECLRDEQIARDGDYTYYKFFDRTVDGEWGVNKFAPIPKKYRQN
jgi:hypothetical protein